MSRRSVPTPGDIEALGREIARASDHDLPTLAIDFVRALARVDGRKALRLDAGPWTPEDNKTIRRLVEIETAYPGEEPVDHEPPHTGKVIEHLRARLDARARENYDIFAELIGRPVDERGEVQPLRQAPIHKAWTRARRDHRRVLLVCSIDTGKTTQNSTFYPVWKLGRNTNERIALIANTAARAADLLRACQDLIQQSDDVKRIFPELRPDPAGPWSTTQASVVRSALGMKEASLSAYGVKGAVQGNRFSLIIADDLTDKENTATNALIEDLCSWWTSTVETRLIEGGQIVYCATPWTPTDLTARLEQSGLYMVGKFPLLDDTGKITWPEHWSRARVDEKRIALGPIDFARFCMCVARTDVGAAFPEVVVMGAVELGKDYPAARCIEDLPGGGKPAGAEIYIGVDLASGSTKKRADNTAIAVVMVEPDGKHTLLDLVSERIGLGETRGRLVDLVDQWMPKAIVVESNGMQSAWCAELKKVGLPVVEHTTSAQNKWDGAVGVESMSVLFANGQFVLARQAIVSVAGRALLSGLLFFDRGKHTADEVMALWIAYHQAKIDRRTAKREVPTVGMRIIGGESSGSRLAERPEYGQPTRAEQRAAEALKERRSRLEKLFDVPALDNDRINDDREAERAERYAAGVSMRGEGITWRP